MDHSRFIHGRCTDCPWLIHGRSTNYPCIFCGSSINNPWVSQQKIAQNLVKQHTPVCIRVFPCVSVCIFLRVYLKCVFSVTVCIPVCIRVHFELTVCISVCILRRVYFCRVHFQFAQQNRWFWTPKDTRENLSCMPTNIEVKQKGKYTRHLVS